jgi:hypothetical protein
MRSSAMTSRYVIWSASSLRLSALPLYQRLHCHGFDAREMAGAGCPRQCSRRGLRDYGDADLRQFAQAVRSKEFRAGFIADREHEQAEEDV